MVPFYQVEGRPAKSKTLPMIATGRLRFIRQTGLPGVTVAE